MSQDGEEPARLAAAVQCATLDDWKLLDVMPGVPERVLRTAYARKLKATKPEVDPAGFQKLRAAYERALASLAEAPRDADARADASAEDHASALAELMHTFETRRRRADGDGALAAVDAALAGTFRAAWRNAVEDALFDSVVDDPSTRLHLVGELARRFDWHEATGRQATRSGDRVNGLRERVEAADMVRAYRARAVAARAGTGPAADIILVTILGPYRVGLFDRALPEAERDVAAVFMNDANQHLAQVDDFVDARMLAAVRAALGATPLASPPPVQPEGAASASHAAAATPHSASRKRRFEWRYIYFALLALMLVGRAYQSDLTGTRGTLDAPAIGSVGGRPDIPNALDVTWKGDGTGLLDLTPLLGQTAADTIQTVRVRFGRQGSERDIPIADLRENGIVPVPAGVGEMWLRLAFTDGTLGSSRKFDLERPKPGDIDDQSKDDAAKVDTTGDDTASGGKKGDEVPFRMPEPPRLR